MSANPEVLCAPCPKVSLLSFIVPTATDAEGALRAMYDEIREQADQVADDWEVLFVDHGVEEKTRGGIEQLLACDPFHVRTLRVEQPDRSDALALGYRQARGEFVFTLEADQDNDVREIAPFMQKISRDRSGETEGGDRWQKIMPRGVLRRVRASRIPRSSRGGLTLLPV